MSFSNWYLWKTGELWKSFRNTGRGIPQKINKK
jgi:hypothetical protein